MNHSAYQYSAATWLNKVLPNDAVVLSGLRSFSLLNTDFVPIEWLNFDNEEMYAISDFFILMAFSKNDNISLIITSSCRKSYTLLE